MESITELKGVERTLLAALKVKKDEYYQKESIIKDQLAKDIFESLNLDESEFKINKHSATAALFRTKKIDQYIKEFMTVNPDGLVVDLGCGLDPRFYRLDNRRITWIDIDLPEVIALKKKLVKETSRYHMLGKSITDLTWIDEVLSINKGKTMLVAEGVLMYLDKEDVIAMLKAISKKIQGALLAFDLCSEVLANRNFIRMLKKADTVFQWGINDSTGLINENNGCRIVEEWRYYDHFQRRYGIANLFRFIPVLKHLFRIVKCEFV